MSFRDRFFTPPVARAITSPAGILCLGAGASVGILAGAGVLGAALLGGLAYAGRVAFAIPRAPADSRIDPFTLSEPWRHHVRDAIQAKARFEEAVHEAKAGPLRDRLREIQGRVDTGVREVWRVARRGDQLAAGRQRMDPDQIRSEIASTEAAQQAPGADAPTLGQALASMQAQLATVERVDKVISQADSQLRLLNARLDEAAARTIELSVQAEDVSDLGGLGDDVDRMVEDMEALRQAIDETSGRTPTAEPG